MDTGTRSGGPVHRARRGGAAMLTDLPYLIPLRCRSVFRRVRIVLVPLVGAACIAGAQGEFGIDPRSESARLAHRDNFWLALSSLDLESLSKIVLSHDEQSFVRALRRLMEGDVATAESSFRV